MEAIQSGLIYGTAGEVDGIVDADPRGPGRQTPSSSPPAASRRSCCRTAGTIDHHEPWLTLEGLRLVFDKNVVTADE